MERRAEENFSFDMTTVRDLSLLCHLYGVFNYAQEVTNYKIAARPERRRQFEKELSSQMEVALSILTACLNVNEVREQVRYIQHNFPLSYCPYWMYGVILVLVRGSI